MTVNSILSAGLQQLHPTAQTATSNGQSSDWLASLQSVLGSTSSTSGGSTNVGGSGLTDQMQALLTQLQAGNTVAPASASDSSASANAAGQGQGASGHSHHHHHHDDGGIMGSSNGSGSTGSNNGSAIGVLQDIASNLAGNTASASGSGAGSTFGNSSGDLLSGLNALGGTALTGAKQAAQAYVAMHGVQLAQ